MNLLWTPSTIKEKALEKETKANTKYKNQELPQNWASLDRACVRVTIHIS